MLCESENSSSFNVEFMPDSLAKVAVLVIDVMTLTAWMRNKKEWQQYVVAVLQAVV